MAIPNKQYQHRVPYGANLGNGCRYYPCGESRGSRFAEWVNWHTDAVAGFMFAGLLFGILYAVVAVMTA